MDFSINIIYDNLQSPCKWYESLINNNWIGILGYIYISSYDDDNMLEGEEGFMSDNYEYIKNKLIDMELRSRFVKINMSYNNIYASSFIFYKNRKRVMIMPDSDRLKYFASNMNCKSFLTDYNKIMNDVYPCFFGKILKIEIIEEEEFGIVD